MRTLHILAIMEARSNPDRGFYYCPTRCSRCGGEGRARCAWLGGAWVCWKCVEDARAKTWHGRGPITKALRSLGAALLSSTLLLGLAGCKPASTPDSPVQGGSATPAAPQAPSELGRVYRLDENGVPELIGYVLGTPVREAR